MCRALISLLRRVIISFYCHNPSRPFIGPSTGSDLQPAHRADGGPFPPAFVLSFQWSTHVGEGQTKIRRSGRARRFRRPGSTRPSGTHRASHLGRALTIHHAAKRRTVAMAVMATIIIITMTTSMMPHGMMRRTARTPAHGINPSMSRHPCRRDESRASSVPQFLLPRHLHHNAASCTQHKRSGRASSLSVSPKNYSRIFLSRSHRAQLMQFVRG
jgi:hypothetical protein